MKTKPDFKKYPDGLVPAIIQDFNTNKVLMLGFMNGQALEETMKGKVTFFSRSRNKLWTKGEESGHFLEMKSVSLDCDSDTLLVKAIPNGPVCHTGSDTCFGENNGEDNFLNMLERIIETRMTGSDESSYTRSLFLKGINKMAQKVGEEATELVIASKDDNRELFLGEAADLLFHYLVLLQAKDCRLDDVMQVLRGRSREVRE
jgi:phosphoribosyl-AMP cyclohydrolase / phosphoribosyl-ATP pyrophosphohydrolase